MYYLVYGLLYLFSLLPLRILYLFSDLAYAIMYYVVKYRREVTLENLRTAFPEKTEAERVRIGKQFLRNLTDSFMETLKAMSISKNELLRRATSDTAVTRGLTDKGYNIYLMAGHQFNWELGNLMYPIFMNIPMVSVYTLIQNDVMNRIFLKIRTRFGSKMLSKADFAKEKASIFAGRYLLVLAADQNPGHIAQDYWMDFFGKPAPFMRGPARGAVGNKAAVIFFGMHKPKRGHYIFTPTVITLDASQHQPEELAITYRNLLEKAVRRDPANYLWSHRRWRHVYTPERGELIDRLYHPLMP